MKPDFKKNPKTDFENIDSLTRDKAREEAEALREEIAYHDHLYYVKNRPEISDALYDRLFKRLQELEAAFPELRTEASPTQRNKAFAMPQRCPACGVEVVREGAYVLCPASLSCPAQRVGRIIHYASREAMDIRGLGSETARGLVENGLVRDIADLYVLSVGDILRLDGFADKSARQLHRAIESARKPRLDRFLYALGIRYVGQRTALVLAQKYRSLHAVRGSEFDDLNGTPEIGPQIARNVRRFFDEPQNVDVLQRLNRSGVRVQDMPGTKKAQPLEGKSFVFTGKLKGHTRNEATRRVEELGGRAASAVSGQTDYLVRGEDPGSKLEDAQKKDIPILDEKAFEAMIKTR